MPDIALTPPKVDNSKLSMSNSARVRMREREDPKAFYYDDGGRPGRGNCTWGIGILAHLGPCTSDELKKEVSAAEIEASFASRVGEAERIVRRRVSKQVLTQDQFDALVSFTYNSGGRGAAKVLAHVDDGDFNAAASGITGAIYMTIRTKKGSKRAIARGLISRRAEESAPFRDSER